MKRKALIATLLCAFTLSGCKNETAAPSGDSSAVSTANVASSTGETPETSDGGSEFSSAEDSTENGTPSDDPLAAKWNDAQYTEDAEIGNGANSVLIEVKIGERSVTLTVKSDKDNLADILTESGIAEGDNSEYGLYIKKVNGVSADYDEDGAYWGLYKDGEPTAVGASGITIADGEHYELVYTLER